jgi:hypothetical protein
VVVSGRASFIRPGRVSPLAGGADITSMNAAWLPFLSTFVPEPPPRPGYGPRPAATR